MADAQREVRVSVSRFGQTMLRCAPRDLSNVMTAYVTSPPQAYGIALAIGRLHAVSHGVQYGNALPKTLLHAKKLLQESSLPE